MSEKHVPSKGTTILNVEAVMKYSNTSRRNRFVSAVAAAAMASVMIVGCSSPSEPEDPQGEGCETLQNVTFGAPTATISIGQYPLVVALANGYFEEECINLTIQGIDGSARAAQFTAAGQVDLGSSTSETFLQLNQDDATPLVWFYQELRQPTSKIAVLADGPIKDFEDLRGGTLGASSLGSANIPFYQAALTKVGIQPNEVNYLAAGVGAVALEAMKKGEVDGLILWDSVYAAMERAQGAELRYLQPPGAEALFSTSYFARPETVENDPTLIERFGRALTKAHVFTKANPAAAIQIVWQKYPETRIAGQSEEDQLALDVYALGRYIEFFTFGGVDEAKRWGEFNPDIVDQWLEFALDGGIIEKSLDAKALYTNEFVDAFNDFDHDAVKTEATNWTKG